MEAPGPETTKKMRRSNMRWKIGCCCLFLLFLVLCALTSLFVWQGGYLKRYVCKVSLPDSNLYNTFNCANTGQVIKDENEQFPTTELDPSKKDLQISSEEAIVTKVVEDAGPSVVGIGIDSSGSITGNGADGIIGSGFIISPKGLIVTNSHVVSDESENYFVSLKDETAPITVTKIYRDPINDIAILKIDRTDLPALPLGDSDKLKVGQLVVAIGNPLGKFAGTVTSGIISGLNRDVQISLGFFSNEVQNYVDVIQTDAAINPGNSGGPLLNSSGEVIGINFATVQGADNLSFALPINRIKNRISELNEFGKFRIPFLGVEYRSMVVFMKGQSTVGAQVVNVISGSPAETAGILPGDIIVEFNGKDLNETPLATLIQQSKIGDPVKVVVVRNKQTVELTATIGEK